MGIYPGWCIPVHTQGGVSPYIPRVVGTPLIPRVVGTPLIPRVVYMPYIHRVVYMPYIRRVVYLRVVYLSWRCVPQGGVPQCVSFP